MRRNVLILSSNDTLASVFERELGSVFDVHAASSDIAAFALLDTHAYACVVVDLSAESIAGSAMSTLRLNALTLPVVALVSAGVEIVLPAHAIVCVNEDDAIPRVTAAVHEAVKRHVHAQGL